eukprot:scaffold12103_cov16-Prasinocladus_malaysianus.AAC.1
MSILAAAEVVVVVVSHAFDAGLLFCNEVVLQSNCRPRGQVAHQGLRELSVMCPRHSAEGAIRPQVVCRAGASARWSSVISGVMPAWPICVHAMCTVPLKSLSRAQGPAVLVWGNLVLGSWLRLVPGRYDFMCYSV